MKKKAKKARSKAVVEFRTLQRVCHNLRSYSNGIACIETSDKCIQNLCPVWKRLVKVSRLPGTDLFLEEKKR